MALGRPAGVSEVDRGVVSSNDRAKVLAELRAVRYRARDDLYSFKLSLRIEA
jgi:hypothetical protein